MYESAGQKDFIEMNSDDMDIDEEDINSPPLDVEGSSPPDVKMDDAELSLSVA